MDYNSCIFIYGLLFVIVVVFYIFEWKNIYDNSNDMLVDEYDEGDYELIIK